MRIETPHFHVWPNLLLAHTHADLHTHTHTQTLRYFSSPLLTNVFVFSQQDRKWWRQCALFKAETLCERLNVKTNKRHDREALRDECSLSNLRVQFAKRYGHLKNSHPSRFLNSLLLTYKDLNVHIAHFFQTKKWPKWNQDKNNFTNCPTHEHIGFPERLEWRSDSSSTDVSLCQNLLTGSLSLPLLPQPLLQMSRGGLQRERADVAVPQRKLSPHPFTMENFCTRWYILCKDDEVCRALQRQRCWSSEASKGSKGFRGRKQDCDAEGEPKKTIRPFKKQNKNKRGISDGVRHFFLSPTWSRSSSFWSGHLAAMELRNHSSASVCIQMLSDFQWSPLHHPLARSDIRASQKNLAKYPLAFSSFAFFPSH